MQLCRFIQLAKMKSSLMFCLIFLTIQAANVYSQYTVNHEVANSIDSTFGMYRRLYNENENFVFSPLSFRIIYSILYQPSKFSSEIELKTLLFDVTKVAPQKSDLVAAQTQNIENILKSPNIRLANKIYSAIDVQLKSNFSSLVAQYRTAIEQVDFVNDGSTKIADRMNNWVQNQTNGLIKNLVEPSSVTRDVQLFLINTVYFKADWLITFASTSVYPRPFKSIDGTQKLIDNIHERNYFKQSFNDELNVDVLELPYTSETGFAFWFILPRPNMTLTQLKDNLSVDFVTKIKESLTKEYIDIQFPIFEIESSIDGRRITPGIFDKNEFDIAETNDSRVSEIKQKAKIIVNTKGTEATAATYVKITDRFDDDDDVSKSFIVDRPFIYAIVSGTTKEPIFIGHFSKA